MSLNLTPLGTEARSHMACGPIGQHFCVAYYRDIWSPLHSSILFFPSLLASDFPVTQPFAAEEFDTGDALLKDQTEILIRDPRAPPLTYKCRIITPRPFTEVESVKRPANRPTVPSISVSTSQANPGVRLSALSDFEPFFKQRRMDL